MQLPDRKHATITGRNAELTAQLKVSEEQIRLLHQQLEGYELLKKLHAETVTELQQKTERAVFLEEELNWLKNHIYGRSSQAGGADVSPDQEMLFNEAEVLAAIEAAEQAHANRKRTVAAHERRHTGGRMAIPKHFPRVVIPHEIPEEARMCSECAVPHPLTRIGEETSERYGYTPPKIWVEHHVRYKYACERTHEGVRTAPVPPHILPKSNASSSLLAHLITAKCEDGLPLFRVARQLTRSHMDLSPGTAGVWMNEIGGEKVVPLINLMHEEQLKVGLIHMDETYLQVLKSEKAFDATHYMVVRAAGDGKKRIILYNYIPSRTAEAMKNLLVGPEGPYRGKLLTDGLERYDEISRELNLEHFGCLQHCRSYYHKARKVSQLPSVRSLAHVAIDDYIREVYLVEDQIKALRAQYEGRGEVFPLELALALRQQKSRPLMEAFKEWVDKLLLGTPPNSALGKALAYTTKQWPKLVKFLAHPDVPPDNNYCEQQIKQYVLGRKAWLFAHSKLGATASANLYSLVRTAVANGRQPFAYLTWLFDRLPLASTVADFEALLPWNVTSEALAEDQKQRERLLSVALATS